MQGGCATLTHSMFLILHSFQNVFAKANEYEGEKNKTCTVKRHIQLSVVLSVCS